MPCKVGLAEVARGLTEYKIGGLIVIGGWDIYTAVIELKENEELFPEFKIPVIAVPAAIG